MNEVNTRQLVALPYTRKKLTLRFYEAVLGHPLEPIEGGEEEYILRTGSVRLHVRRLAPGEVLLSQHLRLPLDDLVGVTRRLREAGFKSSFDAFGTIRDPNGHALTLAATYVSLACRDVKRTEQFYALLGLWMIPSTPSACAVLMLSDEVCALREGEGPPECGFEVSVIGPTLSAIDALNRAGFGPFDLRATKIHDPDGRLVTLKYLS